MFWRKFTELNKKDFIDGFSVNFTVFLLLGTKNALSDWEMKKTNVGGDEQVAWGQISGGQQKIG